MASDDNDSQQTQKHPPSPYLYAAQGLLDRQISHGGDELVCKVDDLQLDFDDDGRPYVTALLAGPLALGPRIGGTIGRIMHGVARRLKDDGDPQAARIDYRHVTELGPVIKVDRTAEDFDLTRLERWARDHIITKLPGADHEDQ